jgi:hypothetical protein
MSFLIPNFVMCDHTALAKEFVSVYYQGMTNVGLSKLLHMFHPEAKCTLMNEEFIGEYNILIKFAEAGISKILYDRLSCISQLLNNDSILLNVSGLCSAVTFWNTRTETRYFSETFIITRHHSGYVVTNHIFKLL